MSNPWKIALWSSLFALAQLAPLAPPLGAPAALAQASVREVEVVVRGGYSPSRIVITEGERLRLRFVRHDTSGCTREVVFPELGLRRALPPHEAVVVELPPLAVGEHAFTCGEGMLRGTIVVQPRAR